VLFTVKILYQNQQHRNGSLASVPEILIKDEPRSGLITKKSEIMEKVERNKRVKQCGDCQGTRHRPQNSFESFTQSWIQKEA